MRRFLSIGYNEKAVHFWLLIFRICLGLIMLTHGIPKMEKLLSGGEIKFPDPLGVGKTLSMSLTVFAEVICSLFLLIGLGTRFAAIPLIITMGVVVFIVHKGAAIGDKELPIFYLLSYITFLIFGGGKYSVDYFLGK